jgi:hypothetical protein
VDGTNIRLALLGIQLTLFGILVAIVAQSQAANAIVFGVAGVALSAYAVVRR